MSETQKPDPIPDMARFRVANNAAQKFADTYVVKGALNLGETSMFYGDSNTGKTAFMIRLGVTICRGVAFEGARVQQGAVIHIAAEGALSVWRRLAPLLGPVDLRADPVDPDAIAAESPYIVWPGRLDLRKHDHCRAFGSAAKHFCAAHGTNPSLVTVDTTVLCIGDRDDALTRDATEAVEGAKIIARITGAHVALIHHTGRDADRGHRGAADWRSNVDAMFSVKAVERDGERRTEVTDEKMRDAQRGRNWRFTIDGHQIGVDEDGDPVTVAVAHMLGAKPVVDEDGAINRSVAVECALDALQRAQSSAGDGFSAAEVWRLCPPEAVAGIAEAEDQKKAVSRVLNALAENAASRVCSVGKARFALRVIDAPAEEVGPVSDAGLP